MIVQANPVLTESKTFSATLSYQSDRNTINRIIEQVTNLLANNNILTYLNKDEFFLVLEEAIVNGMEHGNRWDIFKSIEIELLTEDNYLTIVIKDEGKGFDIHKTYFSTKWKSGGRGIMLIKHFCTPEWHNNGNTIALKIPILQT